MSLTGGGSSGGGAAAGTAKFEKPASGQSLVNVKTSTNNSVFYTVPSGYFFKGYVMHDDFEYSPSFNNVQFCRQWMAYQDMNQNRSMALGQSNEIILPPGTTVKCGYSMETAIIGNLYTA